MQKITAKSFIKSIADTVSAEKPHHFGQLVHFLHGADNLQVKVLGFLPGIVGQRSEPTTSLSSTLPVSFPVHTAQASTGRVGTILRASWTTTCLYPRRDLKVKTRF